MKGSLTLDRTCVVRWLGYALFLGLFLFEILNWTNILTFQIDYTWRGRVISTAFVFCVMRGLDEAFWRYAGQRLSGWVWIAGIMLILVDFFGDVFRLYSQIESYDRFAHGISGLFVVGSFLLIFRDLAARLQWRVPDGILWLLAFGVHEAFSVLYEMEEYLEDVLYGSQRSGGGTDTADDITLSFFFGLLTVVLFALWQMHQKRRLAKAAVADSSFPVGV